MRGAEHVGRVFQLGQERLRITPVSRFREGAPIRPDQGVRLLSVTFRHQAGRWYLSRAWEREIAEPVKSSFPQIGIDRGVAVFAALSDERRYPPLGAFAKIRDQLAKVRSAP